MLSFRKLLIQVAYYLIFKTLTFKIGMLLQMCFDPILCRGEKKRQIMMIVELDPIHFQ